MDPTSSSGVSPAEGFPRTRGDGPLPLADYRAARRVSPHTRGWTRGGGQGAPEQHGFPAHAGMDPVNAGAGQSGLGFPRTRGDGPPPRPLERAVYAVSPHTRGWTRPPALVLGLPAGFPAHAGMDLYRAGRLEGAPRFPRTRGDGPSKSQPARSTSAVSPHTRGWTPGGRRHVRVIQGFPAHAGMDRSRRCRDRATTGFPRTRGDGPQQPAVDQHAGRVSPHTRGWTRDAGTEDGVRAGFPAHAGMDPSNARRRSRSPGFPRTRGDGPWPAPPSTPTRGVSPHTRGWTRPLRGAVPEAQGFPAHAGMDPARGRPSPARGRFPRTRGDGPLAQRLRNLAPKVSPHTRGWTRVGRPRAVVPEGFPAHAGMDPYRGR